MAIKDFENYFASVKKQYFEMREVLKEFDILFKKNQVTEDRVAGTKEYVEKLADNYNILLYVETLLRKRKNSSKKQQERDRLLAEQLAKEGADEKSIVEENEDSLNHIKKDLKDLGG